MRWMAAVVCLLVGGLGGVGFGQTAPASSSVTSQMAPTQAQVEAAEKAKAEAAWKAQVAEALKDYHGPEYVRTEVMIPMRDGVSLHTVIVRPVGSEKGAALPFLMMRTPYGVAEFDADGVKLQKRELAESGYIFVAQDIRGRYQSGGRFVMNRPIVAHASKNDVDETTDTNDTVDWLLKNVPNNDGRVGVLGISYPGFLAMMAGDRCE